MNIEIMADTLAELDDLGLIPEAIKKKYAETHGSFDPVHQSRLTCQKQRLGRRVELVAVISLILAIILAIIIKISVSVAYVEFGRDVLISCYLVTALIFIATFVWRVSYLDDHDFPAGCYDFASELKRLAEYSGVSLFDLSRMKLSTIEGLARHLLVRLAKEQLDIENSNEPYPRLEVAQEQFKNVFDSMKKLGLIPEKAGYGPYFKAAMRLRTKAS